MINLLKKI